MQNNKQKSEDKIKSSLHQFSQYLFQQKYAVRNDFRKSYMLQRKNPQKLSFNELSDWGNTQKIVQYSSLPKIAPYKSPEQKIKNMDFTFYKSQLLNRNSNSATQEGCMNQVILRFNPKSFTKSLRNSLMSFHKKERTNQPEVNIFKKKMDQRKANYQMMQRKSKSSLKQEYQMNTSNMGKLPVSPLTKEKYTGMIRILKKSQINRKKKLQLSQNYELITTKIF